MTNDSTIRDAVPCPTDADRYTAVRASLADTYIKRQSDVLAASFLKDAVHARQNWAALRGDGTDVERLTASAALRYEARGIILTGASGAGKTRLIDRALSSVGPATASQDRALPILQHSVRGPCTLLTLGRQILEKLGYPISGNVKEHVTWELVRRHLALADVGILHLDEIQDVSETANVNEAVRVLNTLKGLMTSPDHPVILVLTGLPSFQTFVQRDRQVLRRCTNVVIETFGPQDGPMLVQALEKLAGRAGLAGVRLDGDLVLRLLHASQRQVGHTMEIAVDAVLRAVQERDGTGRVHAQDPVLHVGHFADEYAYRSGSAAFANPFLADDWHRLDMGKIGIVSPDQDRHIAEAPVERREPRHGNGRRRTA